MICNGFSLYNIDIRYKVNLRMCDMDLIDRIEQMMKDRDWNQKQLAEKADIAQSTINSMFNRVNAPSLPTLQGISNAFGIPIRDLFNDGMTPSTLTQEQMEMFDKWSACTPAQKKLLMQIIDQFK